MDSVTVEKGYSFIILCPTFAEGKMKICVWDTWNVFMVE